MSISPVIHIKTQVLGSMVSSLYWKIWLEYPELFRIIECESNWQNICNKNGCIYGQGLGQIIPSTWKRLQTMIDIGNDPLNPKDNIEATLWLYINEGNRHWGYEGADWGSYECWHK